MGDRLQANNVRPLNDIAVAGHLVFVMFLALGHTGLASEDVAALPPEFDALPGEELSDPQAVANLWEAIASGIEQRLDRLRCVIDYEFWMGGRANSPEDALAGRLQRPMRLVVKGHYVKNNDLMLIASKDERPEQERYRVVSKSDSGTVYEGFSLQTTPSIVESAHRNGLVFVWEEWQEHSVNLSPPTKSFLEEKPRWQIPLHVIGDGRVEGPAIIFGEWDFRYSLRWLDYVSHQPNYETIRRVKVDGKKVYLFWRQKFRQFTSDQEYHFDLSGKYPIPLFSRSKGTSPRRGEVIVGVTHFVGYQAVAHGMIPERRITIGMERSADGRRVCAVAEWRMTSISRREPRLEDFDIRVPASAPTAKCLKPDRIPPVTEDGYRVYNLAKIDLLDLEAVCLRGRISYDAYRTRSPRRGSGWWLAAVITLATVAGLGVAWMVYRRMKA